MSEACAEFRVKYVGAIEKLQFDMSKVLQEPLDLINYIDAAQVRNRLKNISLCHCSLIYYISALCFIGIHVILSFINQPVVFSLTARWQAAVCSWR